MLPMITFYAGSFENVPEVFNDLCNGAYLMYVGIFTNLLLFELFNHNEMVQYVEQLSY